MAIGDNIPGIFADLPNSVMRVGAQTGGNPIAIAQYILNLFEGKDADTELSLTQQGAIDGAPMPIGGPIVDDYLLQTGDPSMAITMAVDGALTGGADAPDLNAMKAGMAALYISDITPLFNDMDSELIGQISTDLGITDNDLISALQDISTQNMLADPSFMGIGEGDFNPLPNRLLPTAVPPPPLPVGGGPMGGELDPTTGLPALTQGLSPAAMAQAAHEGFPIASDLSSIAGNIGGFFSGIAGGIGNIAGGIGDILQSTPYAGDEPTALPSIAGLPAAIGETIGITPSEEALAGEDDFLVRSRPNIFGMPFSQNIPAPTQYQTPPPSISTEDIYPYPETYGSRDFESGIYPSLGGTPFDRRLAAIKVQYDSTDMLDTELEHQLEQLILGEFDEVRRRDWEKGEGTARLHVGQFVQDIITEWNRPPSQEYRPTREDIASFEEAAERARQRRAGYTVEPYVAPPSVPIPGDPGTAFDQSFETEALGPPAPVTAPIMPAYGQAEISVPGPSPVAPVSALAPAAPGAIQVPGTVSPIAAPGVTDTTAAAVPGAIPPFAGIYTDVAPGRAQWQAWMPSVVGGYGMGTTQKAYAPTFSPFYGTYLLSQDFADEPAPQPGIPVGQGFPKYMVDYQPQKLGVQDWSKFEGQYQRLINYSLANEAFRDSGASVLEELPSYMKQAQDNLLQNMGMATAVRFGTDDEKKQFALATALARYYRGNPVTSNYATRLVEKGLGEIYDRIETQTLTERPGANPLTRFFDYIVEIDPGRFGAGGEGATYGP